MTYGYVENAQLRGQIQERFHPRELTVVEDLQRVAWRIVADSRAAVVALQFDHYGVEQQRFAYALAAVFPLLEVHVLVDTERPEATPPAELAAAAGSRPQLHGDTLDELVELLAAARGASRNRRGKQRLSWPLNGRVRLPGGREHVAQIRSISASGGFLAALQPLAEPGTSASISIEFCDFSLLSGCVMLDHRQPLGGLPAGTAFEFTDLTASSRRVLDGIVRDVLLRALTAPGSVDEEPAIGAPSALPQAPAPDPRIAAAAEVERIIAERAS